MGATTKVTKRKAAPKKAAPTPKPPAAVPAGVSDEELARRAAALRKAVHEWAAVRFPDAGAVAIVLSPGWGLLPVAVGINADESDTAELVGAEHGGCMPYGMNLLAERWRHWPNG